MKLHFYISFIALLICSKTIQSQTKPVYGFYVTKEDYLNKKITVQESMQPSENYNVGIIKYKSKDSIEHKINCIKEKYWGFHYLDGCDYMLMNGFYGKIVIVGRIDMVLSPRATYKIDEEGKYWFFKSEDGKINYYYMKDLDPSTTAPFEKLIADDKALMKEYQADRDNYGEFINKQIKYLKKYNDTVPKPKKGNKK